MITNQLTQTELAPFHGIAQVTKQIRPDHLGRIRFQATYWNAKFAASNQQHVAEPHTKVQVIGREGLTLIVVPLDS